MAENIRDESIFNRWWRAAKTGEKWRILIAGLYILSPFDILPELLLGPLGIADDIGAMFVLAQGLMSVTKRYRKNL